ncbi:MAG TPA: hypothetical protein VI256_08530 [Roseiarcus sp.]
MSDNVVTFPAAERESTERDVDALHGEAFRELENRLCDCVNMAKIAFDQICEHKTDNGELVCAVAHASEMLAKLKRDYYATYHDEKPGGLHTSST